MTGADVALRGGQAVDRGQPTRWRAALSTAAGLLLLLAGCATPVQVERIDPRTVQQQLDSNVISTGDLSEPTQIVLRRQDLTKRFESDPEGAIASLHRTATEGEANPNALFALAEMSFRHAEDTGKQAYYLAAAIYAFAFVFPDDPAQRPSSFDPRFRTACDIYNRGLTSGFASADRSRVILRSGRFALPFGSIDVTYDAATARWGNHTLVDFTPADELRIKGLQNRYRQPGIGAPLAADATEPVEEQGFRVAPQVKVPVTALLRIDLSRQALAKGHLRGTIDVYPAFQPSAVEIRGQSVPLEVDTTAAFAYGLSDPEIWRSEFRGFLSGAYFDKERFPIDGLEPYRPGQIPVVFIHGTASSSGRWADLVNDLQSDPVIRDHYQFWWFSYSTGNPTPFSALRLRTAIEEAVHELDPQGKDPALRQIVLIGHSQGGLIAKMLVIDSGSRLWDAMSKKPLDQLRVSPQTRDLLRRAAFVTPVPEVRCVIFIATPQHGSFVAGSTIGQLLGRLVSLPFHFVAALDEAVGGNPDAVRFRPGFAGFGSVWSMSPDNPALQALAAIPISREVSAHSIIAVRGDGPIETGDDGVVTYKSAHIDGVASELVVRSGHSVQGNPRTVAEVRRILLLHLAQACPQGCVPAIATDRPPVAAGPTGEVRQAAANTPRRRRVTLPANYAGEPAK
jgi:pimeloyl-ACP methyl ester carboxylesterase